MAEFTRPEDVAQTMTPGEMEQQQKTEPSPSVGDIAYRAAMSVYGAPVDLMTMFMRPFGYSVPDEQVIGSSAWANKRGEQAGIISTATNPMLELAAALAIPDPFDIVTLTKAGSVAMAGAMLPAKAGIKDVSKEADLLLQHNLTEKNLAYAQEAGGLPVPSLAITKKDKPLEGFGEITML